MTQALKIVVEKHSDGYVAYPLGLARGAVVGQGDSYEAALSDVRSAIAFHVETFGAAALASAEDCPVLEAFVAETTVPGFEIVRTGNHMALARTAPGGTIAL